jgi:uncharacterized protein (DUF1330 family)
MKTNYKVAIALVAGAAIGGAAIQGLHAQAKPPVYYIAQNEVSNPDAYVKEFAVKIQASARAAGARFLVSGGKVTALDGPAPKARTIVTEWDSLEKLQGWFNSPEVKALSEVGRKYATFHIFAVEGTSR